MENPLRIVPAVADPVLPDPADEAAPSSIPETAAAARERASRELLPRLSLAALAGEMIELTSAGPAAGLTAAARLVRQAQENGEPAAWIVAGDSLPYPLDLAETGCDLEALIFIRVPGLTAGARAAEHLLRSGAFGLVLLDLGTRGGGACGGDARKNGSRGGSRLSSASAVRLSALCRHHHAALLLLGRRAAEADPLLPFATLRLAGGITRAGFDRFTAAFHPLKDKRRRDGWTCEELCRGPDGLC